MLKNLIMKLTGELVRWRRLKRGEGASLGSTFNLDNVIFQVFETFVFEEISLSFPLDNVTNYTAV